MVSSQDVLLILLLSIISSSGNIDLNTNSNFLLLLLLTLSNQSSCGCNTCSNCSRRFYNFTQWYRRHFLCKKQVFVIKFIFLLQIILGIKHTSCVPKALCIENIFTFLKLFYHKNYLFIKSHFVCGIATFFAVAVCNCVNSTPYAVAVGETPAQALFF